MPRRATVLYCTVLITVLHNSHLFLLQVQVQYYFAGMTSVMDHADS
jgi:hypothetical protein